MVLIGRKTLPLPILQGGMGIGVSMDGLAGALAACAANAGDHDRISTVKEEMDQIMNEWRDAQ